MGGQPSVRGLVGASRRAMAASCLALVAAAAGASAQERPAQAQVEEEPQAAVMLLMDASGSMRGGDGSGTRKIDAAKDALTGLIDAFPRNAKVGLRVFGGRVSARDKRRGCRDTRLLFPVATVDPDSMKEKVRGYTPRGYTPIALALERAAEDLPKSGRRTIVLVSDGEDTCKPPPPCEVAEEIARKGVDIRIEAVGFRVNDVARRELKCIARVARGTYRDAGNAAELSQELRAISTRAVRLYRPQGRPVRGGPAIRRATEIQPGQYVDSMQPNETRWYMVRLARGETLTAAATLVPPVRRLGSIGGVFRLTMFNPHFESQTNTGEAASANLFIQRRGGIESLGIFGLPAGFAGGQSADFARSDRFGDAGPYYLRVEFEDTHDGELRNDADGRPFATELLVDVLGRAPAAQLPVETAARRERDDDDGLPGVVVAVSALVAALAGLALGAAVVRRRRAAG